MLKKLKIRLILTNMLIVTLMLCIIFGLVLHFTRTNLADESISMMQELAENPYRLGTPNQSESNIRLPYFIIQIGPFGELIAAGGGYYDLSDAQFLQELADIAYGRKSAVGTLPDYNLRYLRTSSLTGQTIVFADMSSELSTMKSLVRSCVLIGGLSFLVFLAISVFLARRAVLPVANAWHQQKQFVADASHELKTPLTVITTNAELLRDTETDEEKRERYTDSILIMSRQMRGLVEQLLELARADSGEIKDAFSHFNLSTLIFDALLPLEPVFFERGLFLNESIEDNITLTGSEKQLRELAEILLDNAQKYSAPGGNVVLSLVRSGRSHCLLCVSNPGAEIRKEDRKNIFKRFYRVDASRGVVSGTGLGLSIAQEIVSRHKGRIWCESDKGINRFYVSLPCDNKRS